MAESLTPVIAATATWLTRAYPSAAPGIDATLVKIQARQAVTVAAWLCYPTATDAALVHLAGPGGTGQLDAIAGRATGPADHWRTWVDEVVASWAACLLGDHELARAAVTAVSTTEHAAGLTFHFGRLLDPDEADRRAGALLRHPDLLAPVADLHRDRLLARLAGQASTT